MKRKKPTRHSLRWNDNALADFESILDQLDAGDEPVSLRFESELLAAIEPLGHFAGMGRVPMDFDWKKAGYSTLRELIVWDYRVGYAFEGRFIEILYVVHVRRRFPSLR